MNELKLDVGCGGRGSRQPGFVGVDIWPRPAGKTGDEYVRLDFIKEPIPWGDETVDQIIALCLIEHLMPDEGEIFFQRCYALLKLGATLTVTTDDLRLLCRRYIERDMIFWEQKNLRGNKELWPGHSLADRLNHAIHQVGHVWVYDMSSLWALAKRALPNVPEAQFQTLPCDHRYNVARAEHLPAGSEIGVIITKI